MLLPRTLWGGGGICVVMSRAGSPPGESLKCRVCSWQVRWGGITHSLAFALFPGAVVLAIGQFHLYAALASLSVILHLIIDSLNPGGVPLWAPLSTKRVRFPVIGGKVKSDSLIANLLIRFVATSAAIRVILT